MRPKSSTPETPSERLVRDIRRATRKQKDEKRGSEGTRSDAWDIERVTLGLEFYGGLGDSVRGLTVDADKTQQYAGINLRADFENHLHVGAGGAFGLTHESEDAILRLTAGYEFE